MNATQRIYRLLSICRFPHPEGGQRVQAKLYRHPETVTVEWWSHKTDATLQVGCLALVEGTMFGTQPDRQVIFGRLIRAETPNASLNLFDTIPEGWAVNPETRKAAADLWSSLPTEHRLLFNQIYWDASRFERYVTAHRNVPTRHPVSHLDWMIKIATRNAANIANDTPQGVADVTLTALLLDAGGVEAPRPNSFVRLLEWFLVAARVNRSIDGALMERMTWKVVQVHALTSKEAEKELVEKSAVLI